MKYLDEETRNLHQELQAAQDRRRKLEKDWQKRIDDRKIQNHDDTKKMEEKHKQTLNLIIEHKDHLRDSIQDALDKGRVKMDEMSKIDLEAMEKQH